MIREVTGLELPHWLRRSPVALVDFYTPTCGPCRQLPPMLREAVAQVHEHVAVYKVRVDRDPRVAQTYGVQSVPSIGIFLGGQHRETLVGLPTNAFEIVSALREYGVR